MKLKSLLFGSAAAVIVASGAQAADPIVAEPEPMEYVKVCDTYGSGFFYIPGTETCLRISGNVRTQYDYNQATANLAWAGRARIQFDAREETDYGTLRGYVRIEGNIPAAGGAPAGNADARINQAYIQLGGWFFGYADSNWVRNEYGGFTIFDGPYGFHRTNIIAYTYAANGFTGTLSLERNNSVNAYAPNVIGRVAYAGSWGFVFATGALDFDAGATNYAVKGGAQFNLDFIAPGDRLRVQGTYGNGGAPYLTGATFDAMASFLHVFNSQWSFRLTGGVTDAFTNIGGAAQIRWNPVNNLSIRTEVIYGRGTLGAFSNAAGGNLRARMRIVRSF